MKFSELLNEKTNESAFVLGAIYGWPLISLDDNKIFAYSSYKDGSRSESLGIKVNNFFDSHKKALQDFLGDKYYVLVNSDIDSSIYNKKKIQCGVSVSMDLDVDIPNDIDPEVFIYGQIERILIDASEDFKNYFIRGIFDSRGSLDFNHKYMSIDIENQNKPDLARRKLNKLNDLMGYISNFNPRLTQEKSKSKNDQFRLNLDYYMGKYGLLSPFKVEYYKKENNFLGFINESNFFIDTRFKDKKLSESISDRNLQINNLAIDLKNKDLSKEEKEKIISKYKEEFLDTDDIDEILYSSQNMKEYSKYKSGYLCEVDNTHNTFLAKKTKKNYVEAHHLIPFCYRKDFDVSIDIEENIVCLCPNCHRKIHLSVDEQKKELLLPLLNKKIKGISDSGIVITEKELLKYYHVD